LTISDNQGADFLAGGGEMGALTRAYDWASTSLGPPETWPQSLRVTIRIMLNTQHPMFIWWGPDLIQFYNDAYRQTMGPERHPSALGQRGRECWAEIWDIIGPQIDFVMSGKGSTWDEDRLVPVTRYGKREDVWWTYSYGPIDLDGRVGGVLVICNDVTAQHNATEALKNQTLRLQQLFEQSPTFTTVLRGPEHRYELMNAAYKQLIGNRAKIGQAVVEALPEVEAQGFIALLDTVYRTGEAYVGRRVPLTFAADGDEQPKSTFVDFVYQPILDAAGAVSGIFVVGTDVTDHVNGEKRLQLLNDELKHRVKNTIAVVSAIAMQTLRGKDPAADLNNFNARLKAFARAHDILTGTNQTVAPIVDVVNQALSAHDAHRERFRVSGPNITLGSQQAMSLSLAIHELATNAFKYGALSNRNGSVEVIWRADEKADVPQFEIRWQEKGGPLVERPSRTGFGSRLITNVLAGDFKGKVEMSYEPSGLLCVLKAPLSECCPPANAR
jgi:two-component sensor histidine kinase